MAKNHPDAHKIIIDNMKQLTTAWPAAMPPATPVKTVADVGNLIKTIEQNTQKIISKSPS
jgi:hypothetical protein